MGGSEKTKAMWCLFVCVFFLIFSCFTNALLFLYFTQKKICRAESCDKWNHVSYIPSHGFGKFQGIITTAVVFGFGGGHLWRVNNEEIISTPEWRKHMKWFGFKEIKSLVPFMLIDEQKDNDEPWWDFIASVEEFNGNRQSDLYLIMEGI